MAAGDHDAGGASAYASGLAPPGLWPSIFELLESTLRSAETALDAAPAADEDSSLAAATLAMTAESLRRVHTTVALLEQAEDLTPDDSGARVAALRIGVDRCGQQWSILDAAVRAAAIDTNLPPYSPTFPTPRVPDPLCMWVCDWLNRIRCHFDPGCLLYPCSLYC